ncbi:MAG: hypothetical protein N4J56_003862 [Chroococcidiopsis sp. SAG 2025]|uniref:hypothetical protein n=1 Tax=Chroococcidiopsis sp. SAG 2025 TaxID=171389 RepID=UPI002937250D|nr:hypothetical protein [Chroococcidiopsis sp. SAG 2025]MDV2994208.1 hypothetical protein [Chroococcidiopsis sp. SAG 2025]
MVLESWQPNDGKQEDVILLFNFNSKDDESVALLHYLLSRARENYQQLSDLQFLPVRIPLPDLELWSYWLAAQLIAKWRDRSAEQIAVGTILARLGFIKTENTYPIVTALDRMEGGTPISVELVANVKAIGNFGWQSLDSDIKEWIEQKAADLVEFTQRTSSYPADGFKAQLQSNVEAMRSQHQVQMQEFFDSLQYSGSRSALRVLETLSAIFQRLAEECEAQKQELLQKAMAAERAYSNLKTRIEPRDRQFGRRQTDWEAVVEALAKRYYFTFNAEIYDRFGQLVTQLIQQTGDRVASITHTDRSLTILESWFSQQCPQEPVFAPILKQRLEQRVDIIKLLSEIEATVSCPLQKWHGLSWTQTELLCQEILIKLHPVCMEVYIECYQYLLKINRAEISDQNS